MPPAPPRRRRCRHLTPVAVAALALALLAGACAPSPGPAAEGARSTGPGGVGIGSAGPAGEGSAADAGPDRLALTDGLPPQTTPARSTTSTTIGIPVPMGDRDQPFAPLPPSHEARAVRTPSGVVVPVIDQRPGSWLVSTPCQGIAFVTGGEPIGRAHVVLDPGHGGREVGAVGPSGLVEKDLNLQVAHQAAEILRRAGATVVLTRTGDHSMTAAARGLVARAIEPALLVSIHHNGGAPPGGDRPGTIVFTGTGSPEARRFGGLLFQTLQTMLVSAAEPRRQAWAALAEVLDAHDTAVAAHDRSVAERDAALVANGQVPPSATTTIPPPTTVPAGELRVPATRVPATTTTVPPTTGPDGAEPVPVPETLPPPEPPDVQPVRAFSWAGSGNAGVRSWTRPDGRDYLAVLRHRGDVPAVLAEFAYLTNPSEEELLADPAFVERQAGALADAIVLWFTTAAEGTGHVADQFDDQPIGGGGGIDDCVEPDLETDSGTP